MKSTQINVERENPSGMSHALPALMRHFPSAVAVALGTAAIVFSPGASAQITTPGTTTTTTTGGASIGPSQQQFPERYVNGNDLGQSTRPQNLTPLGINFNDCNQDMELEFRALVTLNAGDTVQVWATTSADCSQATSRGSGSVATCWRLNAGLGALVLTNREEPFRVRVQDIIGGQTTVGQNPNTPVSVGSEACTLQSSFAATNFNVYIMAMQPDGLTVDGSFWNYSLPVDVVGPPPPSPGTPGIGDTLLLTSWTPNSDSDTGGYDVFVDPPPGTEVTPDASADATTLAQTTLVCPEAGSTSATPAGTLEDASDDAEALDASATGEMAACQFVTTPPPNGANACTSTVLASASTTVDSGITNTTPTTMTLDDGAVVTSETGTGGFTNIDCSFLVGTHCPAGQPAYTATNQTVAGETSGNYIVKGLLNGVNYNISVAAVDNFGNIGPLSPQVCQVPQPVTDFFDAYRGAGGLAGGGFCSIEAVGRSARWGGCFAVFGLVLVSFFRRRSSAH
ncbi:MAG: hypothetical protein FWD17_07760 [Polyangiaceae bacterium]|nr:hypothetical protein [Polyangiaceae bacterium]